MICERCKTAKATVFFTQIIHGQMQKVDLCEECAREVGATSASGFSLADLLLTLKEEPDRRSPGSAGLTRCPTCGMSEEDFRKTGRLGCSTCYEVFHRMVADAVRETQKGRVHRGKVPSRYQEALNRFGRLDELRQRLKAAVEGEHFEQAAALRDQIRVLESGTPPQGPGRCS